MEPSKEQNDPRDHEVGHEPARVADAAAQARLVQLCEMTRERLERMTPAERDRMMQEHLAAARGPEKNFQLLCDMTRTMFELRRKAAAPEAEA